MTGKQIVRADPAPITGSVESRELQAIAGDLRDALTRHVGFLVQELEQTPTQALELLKDRRDTQDRDPDQMNWLDLAMTISSDADAGTALWQRIRTAGRDHVAVGLWGASAVESKLDGPYARAIFLSLRDGLADGLQPRNGLEWLLIDQMAQALTMQQAWMQQHVELQHVTVAKASGELGRHGEWSPPRVSQEQAVEQRALMADRFQRSFLRLLKAYRDLRRQIGPIVVTDGGQLNVADQQIVTTRRPAPRQPVGKRAPRTPARRTKTGGTR